MAGLEDAMIQKCHEKIQHPDSTTEEVLQAIDGMEMVNDERLSRAIDFIEENYPAPKLVQLITAVLHERLKAVQSQRETLYEKYANSRRNGKAASIQDKLDFLERVEVNIRRELAGGIKLTPLRSYIGVHEMLEIKKIGFRKFIESYALLYAYESETYLAMMKDISSNDDENGNTGDNESTVLQGDAEPAEAS